MRMSEDRRLQTVVSRIYNTLISERDWSAIEVCHLLLNLDLAYLTRSYVVVNCRSEHEYALLLISENKNLTADKTMLNKYKEW